MRPFTCTIPSITILACNLRVSELNQSLYNWAIEVKLEEKIGVKKLTVCVYFMSGI